jgi:glycosyltransferase involved in cell wall biosynthesis
VILFVSGEYPPDVGGVGDYTARLRAALSDRGWPSRVLTRSQVRRWDARSVLWLLRMGRRSNIVHIQFQAGAFDLLGDVCLMPLLARRFLRGARVVTTFHDVRHPYLFPRAGRLRDGAVRLMARFSDAIVCADQRDIRWLGGPSPRHHLVPIGPNVSCEPPLDYDRAAFRQQLGLDPHTLAIVYFGLLNSSKGLDLLLDAFDLVIERRPNTCLLLVGGEVGASDATDRATATAVGDRLHQRSGGRVLRSGWLRPPDLSAHLLAGDLALLPYADGASARRGSLLTCAAHGLPIVSTLPAGPEVAGSIQAVAAEPRLLADTVLRLDSDSAESRRLRDASFALTRQMSWPSIAAAHVGIYQSLLYSEP